MSLIVDNKPKVVLDTTVIFAATFNPNGVAAKAFAFAEQGEINLVVSNRLRSEYEDTLTHPAQLARLAHAGVQDARAFLNRVDEIADRVLNPASHITYSRDPDDEHIANLVIEVKADYLVTLDKDLLDLPRHLEFARQEHQPTILRPGAFLTEMERRREREQEQAVPATPERSPERDRDDGRER